MDFIDVFVFRGCRSLRLGELRELLQLRASTFTNRRSRFFNIDFRYNKAVVRRAVYELIPWSDFCVFFPDFISLSLSTHYIYIYLSADIGVTFNRCKFRRVRKVYSHHIRTVWMRFEIPWVLSYAICLVTEAMAISSLYACWFQGTKKYPRVTQATFHDLYEKPVLQLYDLYIFYLPA